MEIARYCIAGQRNEEIWTTQWKKIQTVGSVINLSIEKPRSCKKQTQRANASIEEPGNQSRSDYFKFNVYYLFIDHVLTELDERLSAVNKSIINAHLLLPKNSGDLSEEKLLSHYHVFLTSHEKENLTFDKFMLPTN